MIEAFHDLLDQLYWSGYAVKLMVDDPETYTWELDEFTKLYS